MGIFNFLKNLVDSKKNIEDFVSTEVKDEDLVDALEDEYGAKYSMDGKRLLTFPKDFLCDSFALCSGYVIREGTKVICDKAFEGSNLASINIPESVTRIGIEAFCACLSLTSIVVRSRVLSIGTGAFWGCGNLDDSYRNVLQRRFGENVVD